MHEKREIFWRVEHSRLWMRNPHGRRVPQFDPLSEPLPVGFRDIPFLVVLNGTPVTVKSDFSLQFSIRSRPFSTRKSKTSLYIELGRCCGSVKPLDPARRQFYKFGDELCMFRKVTKGCVGYIGLSGVDDGIPSLPNDPQFIRHIGRVTCYAKSSRLFDPGMWPPATGSFPHPFF
jgi:hypothetical protein